MTPSFTIGGDSWPSVTPVENDHAATRLPTFSPSMRASGLYPHPSYVRRYISQLCGSGLRSRSPVTRVYAVRGWPTGAADINADAASVASVKRVASFRVIEPP